MTKAIEVGRTRTFVVFQGTFWNRYFLAAIMSDKAPSMIKTSSIEVDERDGQRFCICGYAGNLNTWRR